MDITIESNEGGGLNQTLPIFWRFDVDRLFLQELCIETRPFIQKKLELNIFSRSRDILPRVVRTYGFSYDFNTKSLILKANSLSNYKGNLGKIAIGTTIDEISPLLEMILTSSFF